MICIAFCRIASTNHLKWLISKDRGDEALAILIKYHAEGDECAQLPLIEYAQITIALKVENESRLHGWSELFQTSGMRRRSIISAFMAIFSQWSGNSLINLYFVKILIAIGFKNSVVQNKINVGLQGWNLISVIVLATTIPRFPRRNIFLCGTCFVLLSYVMWLTGQALNATTHSKSAGIAALVGIFLFQTAYLMTWNIMMYTYLGELFPFYVRTKGMAWYQLWQRSTGFFSNFVNPIGLDAIGWKYLLIYVAVICFELVFVWLFFPETYNRSLEELAFREYFPSPVVTLTKQSQFSKVKRRKTRLPKNPRRCLTDLIDTAVGGNFLMISRNIEILKQTDFKNNVCFC